MKLFRKNNILFKLIIALCIVFLTFSLCEGTNIKVMALTKTEQKEHQDKHKNETPTDTKKETSNNGNTTTYTYADGCQKIETQLDPSVTGVATATVTWKYNDDSTSVAAGSGTAEDVEKGVENSEDVQHTEALQGGKLLTPIFDLLMSIGDAIMQVIQKTTLGTNASATINLTTGFWGWLSTTGVKILGVIAAIAVVAVLTVATAGVGTWLVGLAETVKLGALFTAAGSTGLFTTVVTGIILLGGALTYNTVVGGFSALLLPDITVFPTYAISPEEIFEGRILLFDINFFNPKQLKVKLENGSSKNIQDYDEKTDGDAKYYFYEDGKDKDGNINEVITSKQSTAISLGKIISKWYYTIRNLAIVIMMLILIYIGIRMMLSSIASEKSKYKKMLSDWVVSMCLVFILHYIMVFAVNMNESIIKLVATATDKGTYTMALSGINDRDKFVPMVEENEDLRTGLADANGDPIYDSNGNSSGKTPEYFIWPTNLLGQLRIMAQAQNGDVEYIGYSIAFLVLVFYTLAFTITYLKRVIYMAFLTVIAPLVAMTYSLDKISDGKAQAFNMWLKEYIGNLLIQPVHLMLYMILISMSFDLAGSNVVYTLVAIGFIMPAEKLIRSMFGLDKAKTPGFLSGAAGAALAMNSMQALNKFAGKGPGGKPVKMAKGQNEEESNDNRGADSGHNITTLLNGENNQSPVSLEDGSDTQTSEQQVADNQQETYDSSSDGQEGKDAVVAGDKLNLKDRENQEGESTTRQQADEQAVLPENEMKEREELERKLASGELNEDELTDEQRALINKKQDGAKIKPNRMLDASKEAIERNKRKEIEARGKRTIRQRLATAKSNAKFAAREAAKPKNLVRAVGNVGKAGLKFTGAALGAGIGAAAGIATGDFNNALKNTGLGLSAGNSIGTGVANGIGNTVNTGIENYKKAKENNERELYGEDYDQYKKYKSDDKFRKDKDARKEYELAFSKELDKLSKKEKEKKLNQIMDSAIRYRQEGVTDNKLIIKAMKLDKGNIASNRSIAAAVMANKAKDIKSMDRYQKDLEKVIKPEEAEQITDNAKKIGGLSI